MNIFIDTISSPASVILFDDNRSITGSISWDIKWNESSTLIPKIDELIKQNKLEYSDLENIVVINWPGSFTGIRTTVLSANSINYIINKNMTALSYFDLFDTYPILKSSSKRDCFVQFDSHSYIQIIENKELLNLLIEKNINKIYWEINAELFPNIEILEKIDYISIIKELKFDKLNQIQALYIKKPNIS